MFPWHIWGNSVFIFATLVLWHWLNDVSRSESLALYSWGQSNWIREHSLMTLLGLVNNVMINVLPTWRRNLSFWSSVFILNTNESWLWWPMFSVAIWAITGNFCFNVTYRFCNGFSRIMPIMILDYYHKPASVHAFYKPCSFEVSVFCFVRCFCVAVASPLCWHVRQNDGCPVCQFSFCFHW